MQIQRETREEGEKHVKGQASSGTNLKKAFLSSAITKWMLFVPWGHQQHKDAPAKWNLKCRNHQKRGGEILKQVTMKDEKGKKCNFPYLLG